MNLGREPHCYRPSLLRSCGRTHSGMGWNPPTPSTLCPSCLPPPLGGQACLPAPKKVDTSYPDTKVGCGPHSASSIFFTAAKEEWGLKPRTQRSSHWFRIPGVCPDSPHAILRRTTTRYEEVELVGGREAGRQPYWSVGLSPVHTGFRAGMWVAEGGFLFDDQLGLVGFQAKASWKNIRELKSCEVFFVFVRAYMISLSGPGSVFRDLRWLMFTVVALSLLDTGEAFPHFQKRHATF